MTMESPCPTLRWEIFCRVIDNFGDIGVCWRLASNLAKRQQIVRLWVDDQSALHWMAPDGCDGVEVRPWTTPIDLRNTDPGDVLVEAFGCELGIESIAAYAESIRARGQKCIWINLEYLSAEAFAQACHGLPSPVMTGPGAGLTKHFFYPGFTPNTGGLLREPDLLARQDQFDRCAWLARFGVFNTAQRMVSSFCYEPAALGGLLRTLADDVQPSCLLVTHGRASAAVHAEIIRKNELEPLWNKREALSLVYLPALSQTDFDHLLWACDLNFVRGEDSLVRAIWAGQPFVWQIYPQDDAAHLAKLDAFLDWLTAPESLRMAHALWNLGYSDKSSDTPSDTPSGTPPDSQVPHSPTPHASTSAGQVTAAPLLDLSPAVLCSWRDCAQAARAKTLVQPDLATQLLSFVTKAH